MCSTYPGIVLCAALLSILAFGPAVQAADDLKYLYQWKDERGVMNVADSLDKVPPKYRSQAKQRLQPGAGNEEERRVETPEGSQSQSVEGLTSEEKDEIKKAEWQQRMHDAKRRLADAEDRYSQIELRKNELSSKFGASGATLPTQDMLDEISRLEGELARAKTEKDRARNEVEVTIPDGARRAGIPPGWLREVQ